MEISILRTHSQVTFVNVCIHDSTIRKHAYTVNTGAKCVVVSVDYRLGPENQYPAAVEDAEESLYWVVGNAKELNVNLAKYAVGGSSRFAILS